MTIRFERRLTRAFGIASTLIATILLLTTAAPSTGAAVVAEGEMRAIGPAQTGALPGAVAFKEVAGLGLVVEAWINETGPYTLAIDTGAGAMMITERVAQMGRVATVDRRIAVSGLSGASVGEAQETTAPKVSLGAPDNALPTNPYTLIVDWLPTGIDGILDPTEAYLPLGFALDMPRGELRAFDPRTNPVRADMAPPGSAVVPWLSDPDSNRPFVEISGGYRALIDTGSRFGIAISEEMAHTLKLDMTGTNHRGDISDLGGGKVLAWRVRPIDVTIGPLVLTRVPTDVISGVDPKAPILLGREALRPFEITFDPDARAIRFTPRQQAPRA